MDVAKLMTRFVLLPFDAAAFGTEMLAQSTKSVRTMAEKGVRSLMEGMGAERSDDEDEED
ncbi:MAG TPA: hypothetical protein VGG06_27660 [Thermoanaerobaculia bacterium]|jgi:hypothetical protein